MRKIKWKETACSCCRHHNNCDEERKNEDVELIVYCLYFCKPAGRIEKWLVQRFGNKSTIARIASFLMTILFPVNAGRVMGKWRIAIDLAKTFSSELENREWNTEGKRASAGGRTHEAD
jgi:hypothetical protein